MRALWAAAVALGYLVCIESVPASGHRGDAKPLFGDITFINGNYSKIVLGYPIHKSCLVPPPFKRKLVIDAPDDYYIDAIGESRRFRTISDLIIYRNSNWGIYKYLSRKNGISDSGGGRSLPRGGTFRPLVTKNVSRCFGRKICQPIGPCANIWSNPRVFEIEIEKNVYCPFIYVSGIGENKRPGDDNGLRNTHGRCVAM